MINSPGTSSSNLVVQDPSKQKPLQPFQQPGKKEIHTFHQLQQYLALCVPAGVGVDCMCARVESSVLCVQDRVLINKPPHKLGKPKTTFISIDHCLIIRRLQGDVVYLGWPTAPSYMSPNAGKGGSCGVSSANENSFTQEPKVWRSNSIFNLWSIYSILLPLLGYPGQQQVPPAIGGRGRATPQRYPGYPQDRDGGYPNYPAGYTL
jgi:hypothetical protein